MPQPALTAILNPRAGTAGGRDLEQRLRRAAVDYGLEIDWQAVGGAGIAVAASAAARRGGCVIAGGGDGTISTVVEALVGSPATLGVLPLGTRNHFAKDLGLPLEPEAALGVIAQGRLAAIDLGQVNGRCFINNSSIGIYPRALLESRHRRSKLLALATGLVRNLVHKRRYRLELILPARRYTLRTAFVFVGNNRYSWDPSSLGRRPRIDRGRVICYLPGDRSHLGSLGPIETLLGPWRRNEPWLGLPLRSFALDGKADLLPVSLDGELHYLRLPLVYRSLPGALRVHVPADHPS